MTPSIVPSPVHDLQGAVSYWGPANRLHTPQAAHPRRPAHRLTPLQVAALALRSQPALARLAA